AIADREEAARLADEELELAREWGAPRAIGMALRARASAAEDPLPWLEEAAELLEATPARLEHARVLLDLGTALRRARRPREARDSVDLRGGRARLRRRARGLRQLRPGRERRRPRPDRAVPEAARPGPCPVHGAGGRARPCDGADQPAVRRQRLEPRLRQGQA